MMYRFEVLRQADHSGVSGTGRVAEGVMFDTGKVVVRWVVPGQPSSTGVWDSILDVLKIHGHGGDTRVSWIDLPPCSCGGEQDHPYSQRCGAW